MTLEERVEALEQQLKEKDEEVQKLKNAVNNLFKAVKNDWRVFQNLLGVQMIHNKQTDQVNLMIQSPKKEQGPPGLLAEIYFKTDAIWKQYGDSIMTPEGEVIQ